MAITDFEKEKVREWVTGHKRKCPVCGAGTENLEAVDVVDALAPEAATERGIDTSATVLNAQIVCRNNDCGFDKMFLRLEDAVVYRIV